MIAFVLCLIASIPGYCSNDDSTRFIAVPVQEYQSMLMTQKSFLSLRKQHVQLMHFADSLHRALYTLQEKEQQIINLKDEIFRLSNLADKLRKENASHKAIYQNKINSLQRVLQGEYQKNTRITNKLRATNYQRTKTAMILITSYAILVTLGLIAAVNS